jgi:hypothetical protein
MRALILGIVLAGVASVAAAQFTDAPNGSIRTEKPQATPASNARRQAEDAVRQTLTEPGAALFRAEKLKVADSVQHGPFNQPIAGVSVVCGQYAMRDPAGAPGAYSWFFAAVKNGELLWADIDQPADGRGPAYAGCEGAGMLD